jgi:alkylhydroperoxidase/carboxymuconolactone decarboxylase family protein YurZ
MTWGRGTDAAASQICLIGSATLANGDTPQELRELMVHSAVYCGFPAALDASRKLTEVLDAANG